MITCPTSRPERISVLFLETRPRLTGRRSVLPSASLTSTVQPGASWVSALVGTDDGGGLLVGDQADLAELPAAGCDAFGQWR